MSPRASAVAGVAFIDSAFSALPAAAAPGPFSAFASGLGSGAFLTSLDSGVESVGAMAGFSAVGFAASGDGSGMTRTSFLVFSPEELETDSFAATSIGAFDPIGSRFCSLAVVAAAVGYYGLERESCDAEAVA